MGEARNPWQKFRQAEWLSHARRKSWVFLPRAARLFLWLIAVSLLARGRGGRAAAIDNFCLSVRNEFAESAPRYFSGPDPWVQLDRLPDSFSDVAVAAVYNEGVRIKWVVLNMAGPSNGWFETTQYFFNEHGLIRKRERTLEQVQANVRVEESMYFQDGKIIKTEYHHFPLRTGMRAAKENWDVFYDPNAPAYTGTADLPRPFLMTELRQVGRVMAPLVCVPNLQDGWTVNWSSLLKFSRSVIFAD